MVVEYISRMTAPANDKGNGHSATTPHNNGNGNGLAALRANRLLRSLADEDFTMLVSSGRLVMFQKEEVISGQSDPVEEVLFIVKGKARAELCARSNGTFKAVIKLMGPGDDIGVLSLLDGAPHSATVTALDDMLTVCVPAETMRDYLDRHKEWYPILVEIAVERLRSSQAWLEALI